MADPPEAAASRRVAILDAATSVFSRYGFKKTSMDDLARAAGLSRQGLYLHFATKEALFQAALLHLVEKLRSAGRAALAREELGVEERLVTMFEAVHATLIGTPSAEHMSEFLEVARELMPSLTAEFNAGVIADVARALRVSGVVASWRDEGFSAKDLAENLSATSEGIKHQVTTQAEYRERMRIAVKMVCSRTVRD
jgi:AcrR family transcriptional regulator